MKMNPVVHFEMPYEDHERLSKFYETVFGWETKMMGEEYGNYVLAMTTESDENGPKKPGVINGGFYQKTDDPQFNGTSIVINVDDIKEQMKIVEKEGGKILGEIMDIPNVGLYVSFLDIEGNRLSMMQMHQK